MQISKSCRSGRRLYPIIRPESEIATVAICRGCLKKISEDEIEFLTRGDDPYDDGVVLKKLYHPNLKLLLVAEGSASCRYYTKEFKGKVVGIKPDAVDNTGAGDSFVAAMLNSLGSEINLYKDEQKLREALLFANGCGALTVQKKGAIPALPTKEAVNQLLQQTTA